MSVPAPGSLTGDDLVSLRRAAGARPPVQALWLPADDRGGQRPGLSGPLLVDGSAPDHLGGALRLAQLLARRDRVGVHVLAAAGPRPAQEARVEVLSAAARSDAAAYVLSGISAAGTLEWEDTSESIFRLAADAATPVLAVPSRLHALPRSALAIVDGGDASMDAARAALPLLGELASLTLLRVVLPDAPPGRESPAGVAQHRDVEALRGLAKEIGGCADVAVHLVVLEGDPLTVLARWVPEFDLVTLGAPGREAKLSRMVFENALGAILVAPARSHELESAAPCGVTLKEEP